MRRTTLFALVAVATAFGPMPIEENPAEDEGPEAGNRRELRRRRHRLPGKYQRAHAGLEPIGTQWRESKARAKKREHSFAESYDHYGRPHQQRDVDDVELQDAEREERERIVAGILEQLKPAVAGGLNKGFDSGKLPGWMPPRLPSCRRR